MMEQFLDQYDDWTERHHDTWIGRNIPGPDWLGAGISAQLDLMSPTGVYDFAMNPTRFNAMKVMYGPVIGFGGFSWVAAVTGQPIHFAQRLAHVSDMALHTAKGTAAGFARHARNITWGMAATMLAYGIYRMTLDSFERYGTSIIPSGGWN